MSEYAKTNNVRQQRAMAEKKVPNSFVHNYEEQFGKHLQGVDDLESIYS